MENTYIEATYPLNFREEDAKAFGEHLRMRHSVDLVGMKRVGISNFLRFFLYQPQIVSTYISERDKYIFIPVDLNDLVERELFPFWILTFKRLVDTAEVSASLPSPTKQEISALFLDAIQSRDIFLTIEGIRKSINKMIQHDLLPTIFFIRFDRIKDSLNQEFFANLQGLREATGHKLAYVFTSFRTIEHLVPATIARNSLSILTPFYLKPAEKNAMEIIFETLKSQYNLTIDSELSSKLIEICGGHVQYLQLALIILGQKLQATPVNPDTIEELLLQDERIALQSEEIWESLTEDEQKTLLKIRNSESISNEEKHASKYLWETGFVDEQDGKYRMFSSLFKDYLDKREGKKTGEEAIDFTKKEFSLFNLLKKHINEVCEREAIIEEVWPEVEILGVSDWTIDRLVARLRTKLKQQKSKYSIVTVKTRGYKLVEE